MKGSKKCKKKSGQNANAMDDTQLDSVQGGVGLPNGWTPADGARVRGKGGFKGPKHGPMTLEERDDWALYGRNGGNKIQLR